MKQFLKPFLALLLIFNVISSAWAELKLPAIISSDMVLQRNTEVTLWGWSDQKKVTIKVSWLKDKVETKADKEGKWEVKISTTDSRASQSIIISDEKSQVALENVLFGEVWLCSGQSNMEQPVKGFNAQPTFGTLDALMKSANPNLRLFTVKRASSKVLSDNLEENEPWQEATPQSVSDFSAVAYFYGQQLQEFLGVPVGLIHTSWGGSSVQAWMSEEALSPHQEIDLTDVDMTKGTQRIPTVVFNAMVNPLIPYNIKGVIWYQGESNRSDPEGYKTLFPNMVADWRSRWAIGDFPIYFVQVAPFTYRQDQNVYQAPKNSAFIREAQLECVDLIPNSGIAILMDIGDSTTIHPPRKKEVGERLLYNALNKTYGFTSIDGDSPALDTLIVSDAKCILKFKYAERGLYAYDQLVGFEIAGEDRVFYPATAKILNRNEVHVSSDQVKDPIAVRYAWQNWIEGTLFDTNLLPASSFRSDKWDNATRFSNQ
ncbi:MAG: sialate O-acetylesterase [Cyclobacteriaceae bacterium]